LEHSNKIQTLLTLDITKGYTLEHTRPLGKGKNALEFTTKVKHKVDSTTQHNPFFFLNLNTLLIIKNSSNTFKDIHILR